MTKRQMFYLFNFLVLAFTVWAGVVDNDREWKDYQKEYKKLEVERITLRAVDGVGDRDDL